jgi:hypothetical protein
VGRIGKMETTWLHSSKRDDAGLFAVYVRKETHPQSMAHHLADIWERPSIGDRIRSGSSWDQNFNIWPVPYYWKNAE